MTLDEAIEKYREKGNPYGTCCEGCEKEHEQLAEWLEELKEFKNSMVLLRMYDKGHSEGYNKAIDDFAEQFNIVIDEKCGTDTNNYFRKIVKEVAEQLKAGGENE